MKEDRWTIPSSIFLHPMMGSFTKGFTAASYIGVWEVQGGWGGSNHASLQSHGSGRIWAPLLSGRSLSTLGLLQIRTVKDCSSAPNISLAAVATWPCSHFPLLSLLLHSPFPPLLHCLISFSPCAGGPDLKNPWLKSKWLLAQVSKGCLLELIYELSGSGQRLETWISPWGQIPILAFYW